RSPEGSTFTSSNTIYKNNTYENSASIWVGSTVFAWDARQVVFDGDTFEGNRNPNGYGGALFFYSNSNNSNDLTVKDTSFIGNKGKYGGAAFLLVNDNTAPRQKADFIAKDSHILFSGNTDSDSGERFAMFVQGSYDLNMNAKGYASDAVNIAAADALTNGADLDFYRNLEDGNIVINDPVVFSTSGSINMNINKTGEYAGISGPEISPISGEIQLNAPMLNANINLYAGRLSLLGTENVLTSSNLSIMEGTANPTINTINGKVQNFTIGGLSVNSDASLRLDVDLKLPRNPDAPETFQGQQDHEERVAQSDNFEMAAEAGAGVGSGKSLSVSDWNIIAIDETRKLIPVYVTTNGQIKQALANNNQHEEKQAVSYTASRERVFVTENTYNYSVYRDDTDAGVYWFELIDTPSPGPDPYPQLSPAGSAVAAMAGMGGQMSMYLDDLSDLRKRLGEVRETAADGLWVSATGQRDHASGYYGTGYRQTMYRLNFGLDRQVNPNWLIGGSLKAATGQQKTTNSRYKANGDVDGYGLNLYATYTNPEGWYGDFVLSASRYKDAIRTNMLDGKSVRGTYTDYGYGISAEIGRKIAWGENSRFFVEPQTQLSYFHVKGDSFNIANFKVRQDNYNSLTGRIGGVIGMQDKTLGNLHLRGGVKHEFGGQQKIRMDDIRFEDKLLGTRVYYGIGGDWNISKNARAYAYLEREDGAHYGKEFETSIGMKYQF
ncbi:MAG: autotransporter outer membrane beta-barrel domain-containing protein, partial [Oxalobacter sp.]